MGEVTNNSDQNRFELDINGEIVFANYKIQNKTLYINYVESPVALRGTGAAGELMEGIMQIAYENHYKIIPVCSYAVSWIKRHDQYHDLLA